MSKQKLQKLIQQMAGKKKKKVKKPDPRAEALKGRKYFSKGSGENDMAKHCLLYTSPRPRDRQRLLEVENIFLKVLEKMIWLNKLKETITEVIFQEILVE